MFIVRSPNLITLEGSPLRLGNSRQHAYHVEAPNLSSYQGITPVAKEHSIYSAGFTSIRGIHKHIKQSDLIYHSDEIFTQVGGRITEGGLGLLLIQPLDSGWQFPFEDNEISDLLWRAKHSNKDIHLIQDELIEQGYDQYARL